jgi:hypothetical protein
MASPSDTTDSWQVPSPCAASGGPSWVSVHTTLPVGGTVVPAGATLALNTTMSPKTAGAGPPGTDVALSVTVTVVAAPATAPEAGVVVAEARCVRLPL